MRFLSYAILPFLWFLSADVLELAPSALLPKVSSIIVAVTNMSLVEEIAQNTLASASRWAFGYVSSIVVGVSLGFLLGMQKSLHQFFNFSIEFFRFLPVTAIFPVFLLLFGTGDAVKIAMVFYASFFIVLVNTIYGVTYQNKACLKMATSFGCSKLRIFWNITAFDALPHIFVGLRIALAISIIVTIVSEMFIGTNAGLGQSIYNAYLMNSSTELFVYLIITGLLGYSLNSAFQILERKSLYWVKS